MQVCTPARQPHGDIRNYLISCRHQADQIRPGRALTAPDAGTDRYSLPGVQLTVPWRQRHRLQRDQVKYDHLQYDQLPSGWLPGHRPQALLLPGHRAQDHRRQDQTRRH
jgi:hypothetical protein